MHPPNTEKLKHYRLLFIAATVVFVLDQLTKTWIFNNLQLGSYYPPDAITVIEGFFYIVHIGNEGAAWGMLSGYSGLLSIIGILGNLIDRLVHGHVIDFLDFHFPFTIPAVMPTGRYPSFNIADCGIVVGTIVYVFLSFRAPAPATPETGGESET